MIKGDGKRRSLGRGLEALLGSDDELYKPKEDRRPTSDGEDRGVLSLPVGDIRPGKYQPRRRFDEDELRALADSIEAKGILQPVLVRPHPKEKGAWELVAGERRWLAAQRVHLGVIPAIVHDLSDRETLEVGIIENVQRRDLTPMEEAEGYKRLIAEFRYTQDDLAKIVGKSRSHVTNTMRLLNLAGGVKKLVDEGKLSAGHARALLKARNPEAIAEQVVNKGLSVREAEKLAQGGGRPRPDRGAAAVRDVPTKDADTIALERDLEGRLGLNVSIDHAEAGGQVVIRYNSLEQLDDLLIRLRVT
ncbi:MAG: ParB/RepB/Spo0J family partition protein [Rhodospirillaceae bacterium]|nr:ParB/RepB/Spo0J family partition protein [Rhodospirillaceae bacterium]